MLQANASDKGGLPCLFAALIGVSVCVGLAAGDTVVQNGATSAVGLAVVQLAKALGCRTINVVRKRCVYFHAWRRRR